MENKNEEYYKGYNEAIYNILKWLNRDYSIEKTISVSKLKDKLNSKIINNNLTEK